MTMFLPLNDVIGLMKLEVKAIRDGLWKDSNGISQPSWGPKAEGIRKDLMKQKAEREGWGIDDRTVVVAVKKGEGMVIEEMTWYLISPFPLRSHPSHAPSSLPLLIFPSQPLLTITGHKAQPVMPDS